MSPLVIALVLAQAVSLTIIARLAWRRHYAADTALFVASELDLVESYLRLACGSLDAAITKQRVPVAGEELDQAIELYSPARDQGSPAWATYVAGSLRNPPSWLKTKLDQRKAKRFVMDLAGKR